ncbi:MAG: L,D-transpeptidase family protein [Janthinobacterium lividum]
MSINIICSTRLLHVRMTCAAMLLLSQTCFSAASSTGDVTTESHLAVQSPSHTTGINAMLTRLYSRDPPEWLAYTQEQARLAVRLLGNADTHGLNPEHYDADSLVRRLDQLRNGVPDDSFERDLSRAMLQYLADVHFGRVGSPYRTTLAPTAEPDLVENLRNAVNERRVSQVVDAAAPALLLYDRVRKTLAQYRELARMASQWPALPPVGRTGLVAGTPYAGTAVLYDRLRLLGDLADETVVADNQVYSAELAAAVRRFQARHGLAEDGVLGSDTLAALSVPLAQRVEQLTLTLERLRWLPAQSQSRIVAINVPAYRLWAVDLGDAPNLAIEMRVIVGKAVTTPTPLFIGQMRHLEFNPFWNVPRSIEVGEIAPKLARNPNYLQENDMELVSTRGQPVSMTGAEARTRIRSGTVRVRQRPGAKNVLGEVKFAMPNPMNIYLHSTSSKELFERTRRDLSHGCIRVERPAELARFVLDDQEKWSADKVAAAMRPGPPRKVVLAAPIPVVLFYATAITDRNGRAVFAHDIYGLDLPLLRVLTR